MLTMQRRDFLTGLLSAGAALEGRAPAAQQARTDVTFERPTGGMPHKGKMLAAIQAHSDDVPLFAAGTVAKLINEGYRGVLIRTTNDDLGDARGLGTPGTIGQHVLGNERDNDEVARVLGLERVFNFNYNNHRMGDVSLNELICRFVLLIRALKIDTMVCWDPWAHDEENPDHYMTARGVEAACWMAGRDHDYPEQFAAGLATYEVKDKYYFARRPEITRVVDISAVVDKKVEANRANKAKDGRQPRLTPPRGAGEEEPAPPAARNRRRHRRPQLHQGVRPGAQPRARTSVRRRLRRSVPLRCSRRLGRLRAAHRGVPQEARRAD